MWAFHDTGSAYTAAKYLNVVVMASAAIPVYLIARRLVSPRASVIAALGSICTSALFYAPLLLPEVPAYPTFLWFAYVSIRALEGGSRRWIAAAVVLAVVSVEVRTGARRRRRGARACDRVALVVRAASPEAAPELEHVPTGLRGRRVGSPRCSS